MSIYETEIDWIAFTKRIPPEIVLGDIMPYVEPEAVQEIVKGEAYRELFFGGWFLPLLKDKFHSFDISNYARHLKKEEQDIVYGALKEHRANPERFTLYMNDVKYIINKLPLESGCCMASYYGWTEYVKRAIQSGHVEGYISALELACRAGHLRIVELLTTQLDTSQIQAALRYAIDYSHLSIVELLTAQLDTNQIQTALHYAMNWGHLSIVEVLISQPTLNLAKDGELRDRMLHCAGRYGHLCILELLITHLNISPVTPGILYRASMDGHLDIVDFFLAFPEMNTALRLEHTFHCAVAQGQLPIVKRFLEDKNFHSIRMPLHLAQSACKGHLSVVDYLLTYGYDWEEEDIASALRGSITWFHPQVTFRILQEPQAKPTRAFQFACRKMNMDLAKKIDDHFEDVNPAIIFQMALEEGEMELAERIYDNFEIPKSIHP